MLTVSASSAIFTIRDSAGSIDATTRVRGSTGRPAQRKERRMKSSRQQWKIGDVSITRIVESEIPIPPQMMFGGADLGVLDKATWLRPSFVTDEGLLNTSIHAFVVDDGEHRIVVDTCIGNDKTRTIPFWNKLSGPFLDDLAAAGYPADNIDRVL